MTNDEAISLGCSSRKTKACTACANCQSKHAQSAREQQMPTETKWTDQQVAQFHRDGYYIARGLFTAEEVGLLKQIGTLDRRLAAAGGPVDKQGGTSRLWLSAEQQEDVYNACYRSSRIVDPMEQMLGGEVYLYHYKMMLKEPRVGGAWEWHQDYGYWYNNGCLYPLMASAMIAVDRASKENGCLQVLPGSHHLGRIEHGKVGSQTGANPDRVELALAHMQKEYAEMAPGDVCFFHSNTLHCSDANTSENSRWTLICCYNAARNPCENRPGHPTYSKLERWPDSKVVEIGSRQLAKLKADTEKAEAAKSEPANA